jgi:hypothetical protein
MHSNPGRRTYVQKMMMGDNGMQIDDERQHDDKKFHAWQHCPEMMQSMM